MQMVATDFMGPFSATASGNKYILVASDYFISLRHSQPGGNHSSWEIS